MKVSFQSWDSIVLQPAVPSRVACAIPVKQIVSGPRLRPAIALLPRTPNWRREVYAPWQRRSTRTARKRRSGPERVRCARFSALFSPIEPRSQSKRCGDRRGSCSSSSLPVATEQICLALLPPSRCGPLVFSSLHRALSTPCRPEVACGFPRRESVPVARERLAGPGRRCLPRRSSEAFWIDVTPAIRPSLG